MYRTIRCFSSGKTNYYDILGVSKSATQKEIKQAFIQLSKKYHPDITGSNEAATKKFVQVKEAYDVLKDEQKRRDYDSMGSFSGGNPFGQSGGFGYQGRYPNKPPFDEDLFRQFRQGSGNGQFHFRSGNMKFTNEDFERIWRQFQKMTQNPQNARYDEQMYREARQRTWDEFTKKRQESWQRRAEEHAKRYPFDNMQNPLFKVNWERLNKMVLIYVGIFFVVALFQTIYSSGERKYQRPIEPAQPSGQITPNESLRDLMNRPPVTHQQNQQFTEDRPFGYPQK